MSCFRFLSSLTTCLAATGRNLPSSVFLGVNNTKKWLPVVFFPVQGHVYSAYSYVKQCFLFEPIFEEISVV